MMSVSNYEFNEIERYLTPSEEEQVKLILRGECPHNAGWTFKGFGHNDKAYKCNLCSKVEWY
jgi:hypothetical protein